MSVNPSDKGLLTPHNCVVLLIDHQPQMFMGVASIFQQILLKNLLVLANAAKIFSVPVVLTAIESKEFKGDLFPELLELFPDETPIKRSSMNSWESPAFVAQVKKTGRKNLVIAAPWTEVCLTMPALQALTDGYFVYAVEDASGGLSPAGHHAALRRIEQAGAVSVTALQVLLEFQRDWARNENCDEVIRTVKAHCTGFGLDSENARTGISEIDRSITTDADIPSKI
ncbi:MAG: isochorismatase family protein [Candidatus Acidiferrum sp.]